MLLLNNLLVFCTHEQFEHQVKIKSFVDIKAYPSHDCYREDILQVSEIHRLYYAEFGNPEGVPVLVLHGGPGAGCCPEWAGFFDPTFYRIIMLDQRGAGKSMPSAEMHENTPQHLIADIEQLRAHLAIDAWILFGGSWGSALSLLYAEAYNNCVLGMVLRGVFLAREQDYKHLFYGMKHYYPEAWDVMVRDIPLAESDDLIAAFCKRVMDSDPSIHLPAAHAFMRFDTICGTLLPTPDCIEEVKNDDHGTLGIARAFIYYSTHNFFLQKNQIVRDSDAIKHIPTIIVQGRYDMICPVAQAYELYKHLPQSVLWIVPDAGHFSSEQSIIGGLRFAMDTMKSQYLK